ncbi:MAG: carboxynorspermidine decarboxylase [Clostridia bacterium]|nr:carboxynorspermidine decarboxylase [Clostridia bacterium]
MTFDSIPTPSYVIDEAKLIKNLEILKDVEDSTGAHILLAQKAFSNFCVYPLIGKYISGTTASGIYEARLGFEEMGKENHVFAPAYKEDDMKVLGTICDHIIFNSVAQLKLHAPKLKASGSKASLGLRLNPECSTQEDHAIYDPCSTGSRLGVTRANLDKALAEDPSFMEYIDGFHFHTLCEQNSDDLKTTVDAFIDKFGDLLPNIKWLNMGGGHHITRPDYDIDLLKSIICDLKAKYGFEIYLEPGEAVALNAGYLVTEVMDIVDNSIKVLILDASAACHMPDVLEMPYRPPLKDSSTWEDTTMPYKYRLSSLTCLAGDVIGDYSFDHEIKIGDRLIFEDMAIYSMVKNNTFNGIPLPSIYLCDVDGELELIKKYDYSDFKERLS